jgi:hypothetical protein
MSFEEKGKGKREKGKGKREKGKGKREKGKQDGGGRRCKASAVVR